MEKKFVFAVYAKTHGKQTYEVLQKVIEAIENTRSEILIFKPLYQIIKEVVAFKTEPKVFESSDDLLNIADCMLSVGGDGTFLGTVPYIKESNIPIIGINNGRLGFLANTQIEEIEDALNQFINGKYTLDKRTLLEITPQVDEFEQKQFFALNDITIRRSENASMLSFQVAVNGEFLNNYWADGIIISTPTGSTAYSLSCGGPILTPDSNTITISPIASHTLTVRPLVLSDECTVKVSVSGRSCHYTLGIDSFSINLKTTVELLIKKAPFCINIVQFEQNSFFKTIRDKLMWGFDKRN